MIKFIAFSIICSSITQDFNNKTLITRYFKNSTKFNRDFTDFTDGAD